MGRQQVGLRKKRNRKTEDDEMGFGDWGGYMDAKRAKLIDQFHSSEVDKLSDIFKGIAIHVNGLTKPPINELKNLMAAHGGLFHAYQVSSTTHIIASNLPNVKVKQLGPVPIVKPCWITDSIEMGKLLDYRRYLLYTNQSVSQPKIQFTVTDKRAPAKTASDPAFLEEFYSNSRLHLISTLGAEYKQLIGQMRDNHDGKFPGKEKLFEKFKKNIKSEQSTIIMHIDMDCFFVSVGLRNHPELKGKPVAITHARNGQLNSIKPEQEASRKQEFALYGERLPVGVTSSVDKLDTTSSMSEIASCSYEARNYGIRNGMFLGQAVKLCPELKTLPYDFEGYKEVSHALYNTITSYTLDIEAVSCDEMYVDVTKILRDTGLSVEEWANHIRNEIISITGCPCSTGFGGNRLQARLATKKAKPDGYFYLKPEQVSEFFSEILLGDIPGIGRATIAKLNDMGLRTCGDVQLFPLATLQSKFGLKAGKIIKDQAEGVDSKPLNFQHERKSVSAEVNYGIRFKTIEEVQNFLKSLSEEVYRRLEDFRARCLTLKLLVRAEDAPIETAKFLGCGVCDVLTKSTTGIVFNTPETIYKEVRLIYDKLEPKFEDLRGVGIKLSKLEKSKPLNKMLVKFLNQENVMKKEVCSINEQIEDETEKSKTTKNNNEIQGVAKYFVKTKGVEINNKKFEPKAEEIDPKVLNELPEDIREEIINQYQLYDKLKIEAHPQDTSNEGPMLHKNGKDSPFSNLSWERFKIALKQWTDCTKSPEEVDTKMIADHLKEFAVEGKIEYLLKTFNFLHRIFIKLNCNWHNAYGIILNVVQEGMIIRYAAGLHVKKNFGCCKF